MIDLKHPKLSMRTAVGECIEAGAQDNVLPHAPLDGLRQLVFCVAAPCHHKRTKGASNGVIAFFRTGKQLLGCFGSHDRHGQGIVEDSGLVKKLVGGASEGNLVRSPAESSLLQRKLSCLCGGSMGVTFFTRANIPQKLPGIDAQFVPVIPMELDSVFAYALGRQRLCSLLEHGKGSGREFRPLAGLAAGLPTLVVTKGTGKGIAQEGECVVRVVAVLPVDVQARTGCNVYFDGFWIRSNHFFSIARKAGVGRTLLSAAFDFGSAGEVTKPKSKAADKSVRPTQQALAN